MSKNTTARADREHVAIDLAWDDLSPETRAMADDFCAALQRSVHGVGPKTAREILAALVRWEAEQDD